MATFNYLVSNYERRKDKTRNVMIVVYHNNEYRYPKTNIYLRKEDLTKSLKIKNQIYIDELNNITSQCIKYCNENSRLIKSWNINELVKVVDSIINIKSSEDKFQLDFIKYGYKYSEILRLENRKSSSDSYKVATSNFKRFLSEEKKIETIDINDIRSKLIKEWILWIQKPVDEKSDKGRRAKSLYPTLLKKLFNEAKDEFNDEDFDIINIPYSPFEKIKIPTQELTRKRAITREKIQAIYNLSYEQTKEGYTSRFNLGKDIFILSFLLIGMNAVDLYRCNDCSSGRITYKRSKTTNRRKDKALISVKIESLAAPLIEKYKDPTGERVFIFYKMYGNHNDFTKALNIGLKKIGKLIDIDDLEFYAARHSWASIARNKCGISKHDVDEFLGHVNENLKVADIYIEKDYSLQDKANKKVISTVFGQCPSIKKKK